MFSCAVAVGLLQELFIFSEDVGNAEVCVQLSGEVNENINVMLNTRKGTATRKLTALDL